MKVNYSIPVQLFDFRESDNPLYSLAKLKIFYIGQTADKRTFTKEFSDQLIQSLPYVPVVGYYDVEKDDFKGHNREIQNIYGIVPEDTDIEYMQENGKEYVVCDVILYTGRKDDTGEIAQKIVGKSHSLELNPDDTEYEVQRNSEGQVINIEFTKGSLLGLSVLGDDETPAFDGSEFFSSAKHHELLETFEGFKEQIVSFANYQEKRGEDMEKGIETALSFLKKTYGENMEAIYDKLFEVFPDGMFLVEQVFDDNFVVVHLDDQGNLVYKRFPYQYDEDENIVLGESTEVFPRYLTVEEAEKWESDQETDDDSGENDYISVEDGEDADVDAHNSTEEENLASTEDSDETEQNVLESTENSEDDEETDSEENENFKSSSDENTEGTEEDDTEASLQHEEDGTNEQEEEAQTEDGQEEENLSSIALSKAEREELETYRREKKEQLIDSFDEDLSRDFLDKLKEDIDSFSYEDLDVKLSREFTRVVREQKTTSNGKPSAFVIAGATSNNNSRSREEVLKERIKYYSRK